ARDGHEPERRRRAAVVVEPGVAALLVLHELRGARPELRSQPLLPEVRRLDDVGIAGDHRVHASRLLPRVAYQRSRLDRKGSGERRVEPPACGCMYCRMRGELTLPNPMGLVYADLEVRRESGPSCNVRFLVDSGATLSVLPWQVWHTLGLKPLRSMVFTLADGTTMRERTRRPMRMILALSDSRPAPRYALHPVDR